MGRRVLELLLWAILQPIVLRVESGTNCTQFTENRFIFGVLATEYFRFPMRHEGDSKAIGSKIEANLHFLLMSNFEKGWAKCLSGFFMLDLGLNL